jgi:hypothetical protein
MKVASGNGRGRTAHQSLERFELPVPVKLIVRKGCAGQADSGNGSSYGDKVVF